MSGPEKWAANAACLPYPTEMFFPASHENATSAKEVCRQCPVSLQCLEYALRTNQSHGIWGGTSERERRRIKALRRKIG